MRSTLIAAGIAAVALPALPALALPLASAPAPAATYLDFTQPSATSDSADMFRTRRYYTTSNGVRYWRGNNGRYYCRRSNGTTGLLIGGAAGALVGRAIDGGRHNTTGTILGAAGGALLGRQIDRDNSRRRARCR